MFSTFCFGKKEREYNSALHKLAADTNICAKLIEKIDAENDHTIWIKTNLQLLQYCDENLSNKNIDNALRQTFLTYKSTAFSNYGAYYVYSDNPIGGIEYYRKGLQIAKQINFNYGIVLGYQNIGTAKDRIGELDSAIYYLKIAFSYCKKEQ